jgi:hypothetical protein
LGENGNTDTDGYNDATGNGAHGTGNSLDTTSDVNGIIGRAQDLDGSCDYITISQEGKFDITDAVTVSTWIKIENFDIEWQAILTKGDNTWRLQRNQSTDAVYFAGSGLSTNWELAGADTVNDSSWHHIAGVYDGSNLHVYVDGVLDSSVTATGSISTNDYNVKIGENAQSTGRYFDGIIDESWIMDVGKDSNWIKLSYENQKEDQTLVNVVSVSLNSFSGSKRFYFNTTSSGANISNNVTDFPMLIRINSPDVFSTAQNNGEDIRFVDDDGYTMLKHDIEYWDDENNNAAVWVLVPQVDGNSYTDHVTMYYGNSQLEDGQIPSVVWDTANAFQGVWHMGDNPHGDPDQALKDATINSFNMTPYGSMDSSDLVAGIIGKAIYFDGSNDRFHLGSSSKILRNVGSATISAWIKLNSTSEQDFMTVGTYSLGGGHPSRAEIGLKNTDEINLYARSTDTEGDKTATTTTSPVSTGEWFHITGVYDYANDSLGIYINGELEYSTSVSFSQTATDNTNPEDVVIGAEDNGALHFFDGIMDEVSISRTARSADWIKLAYETQKENSLISISDRFTFYPEKDGYVLNSPNSSDFSDTLIIISGGDSLGSGGDKIRYGILKFNIDSTIFSPHLVFQGAKLTLSVDTNYSSTVTGPVLLFPLNNDGVDYDDLNFLYRDVSTSTLWRHGAFEDDDINDFEGIGTEDLLFGYWNHFEGAFHNRGQIAVLSDIEDKTLLEFESGYFNSIIANNIKDSISEISFLVILKEEDSLGIFSSEYDDLNLRPKLELFTSQSELLFSWDGRGKNIQILKYGDDTLSLINTSIGDGSYDRVIRYHDSTSKAVLLNDSLNINYHEGTISFSYQKTLESGDGEDAVLFRRNDDSLLFELSRIGTSDTIQFKYGPVYNGSKALFISTSSIFNGKQNLIQFSWAFSTSTFKLTANGRNLPLSENLNPVFPLFSYENKEFHFGVNTDGYLENIIIFSREFISSYIEVEEKQIKNNFTFLPPIPSSFNDTVECIVIAPPNNLMLKELEKYANRNISMGIRTHVLSLDLIEKFYTGSDLQEKIRNFLKQAYSSWYTKWLILGASHEFIPTRKVFFKRSKNPQIINTDKYYANLEGNWNDDGDLIFAEFEDNTDLTSELIVGRFPAENWYELRTMIEKSNVGMGLPLYGSIGLENSGTTMVSGIRMFRDFYTPEGSLSDGAYYGNQLADILDSGVFSSVMNLEDYFPSDVFPPDRDTTNSIDTLFSKTFLDTMTPAPGLWIHLGHGFYNLVVVDEVGKGRAKSLSITTDDVKSIDNFNKFQNMTHYRILGCVTASQDQHSIGRELLAKPYGGALTYIAASEYSYPSYEFSILNKESNIIADSIIFTWGEVYTKSFNDLERFNTSYDIGRRVAFTRNYLGDPLLPVRYKNISSDDTLKIDVSGTINWGEDTVTITVTDKDSDPVEGVNVGLVSNRDVATSSSLGKLGVFGDFAFAHGITNKKGKTTLIFKTSKADELSNVIITASHHNFRTTRKIEEVSPKNMILVKNIDILDSLGESSSLRDYVFQSPESLFVQLTVQNQFPDPTTVDVTIDQSSGSFTDDDFDVDVVDVVTGQVNLASGDTTTYKWWFNINKSPGATKFFTIPFKDGANYLTEVKIPIVGPKILPVITFVTEDGLEIEGGDDAKIKILFGNSSGADALGVVAKVIDENTDFITVSPDSTSPFNLINGKTLTDSTIEFTVDNCYSEDQDGIIAAKLVIYGENMSADTIEIDFNPLGHGDVDIDKSKTSISYKGRVHLEWNNSKYIEGYGRNSDFLGYVVTRRYATDSSDTADVLLTPSPITASSFIENYMPLDKDTQFIYTVYLVDSSYNYSAADSSYYYSGKSEITVSTPPRLRDGFPVYSGSRGRFANAMVSDRDNDGLGDIYSTNGEKIVGFREDGQETAPSGKNDGFIFGPETVEIEVENYSLADLDFDGRKDFIGHINDSAFIYDFEENTNIGFIVRDSNKVMPARFLKKPVFADMTGDGNLEVIILSIANSNEGATGKGYLDVYSKDGVRLARKTISQTSYAPAVAVGDFKTGNNGLEIILGALSDDNDTWLLYCLGEINESDTSFDLSEATGVVKQSDGLRLNSALSVGNVYGSSDVLEIAFTVGKYGTLPDIGDTLIVYGINTTTGQFFENPAKFEVNFPELSYLFGSAPAIGQLDTSTSQDEIVLATEDSIYFLKMTSQTVIDTIIPPFLFGFIPSNRIDNSVPLPQSIIADIDNDCLNEVVVNHGADGHIWAFNDDGSVASGFPLKTEAIVTLAPQITDIDANGILDLIAHDDGGYIYSWSLDSGDIYSQPWPSAFGNSWNTAYTGYKPAGEIGFLQENWFTKKKPPYKWKLTEGGNGLDTAAGEAFSFDGYSISTSANNDTNLYFTGLGSDGWDNYTIKTKLKFSDATAEFGINFYGQWPDTYSKYCLIRESDGELQAYRYTGQTSRIPLGKVSGERLTEINTWYDVEIKIVTLFNFTDIYVNDKLVIHEPTITIDSGRVGLVAHSGDGTKYWGPFTVVSNVEPEGANMAFDDFVADSIVDITPYTPQFWRSDLPFPGFMTGKDSSGFLLVKGSGPDKNSLGYREGDDLELGVSRLMPDINLSWRNYEYRGTLIKPADDVYDDVEMGVIFHADSTGENYYKLACKGGVGGDNRFVLSGGGLDPITLEDTANLNAGDTVHYSIRVSTNDFVTGASEEDVVKDSVVWIRAKVWKGEENILYIPEPEKDNTVNRLIEGPAGVYFKKNTTYSLTSNPLKWRDISVTKGIFKPGELVEDLPYIVFKKDGDEAFRIKINGDLDVDSTLFENQSTNPVSGYLSFYNSDVHKLWTDVYPSTEKFIIRMKGYLDDLGIPPLEGFVIRNPEDQAIFEIEDDGDLVIKGEKN